MPTHKSAEKRLRQSQRRRLRNRGTRSELRTLLKNVRAAVTAGDLDTARQLLSKADKELSRAASRNIIPAKRASRQISRTAKLITAAARPK